MVRSELGEAEAVFAGPRDPVVRERSVLEEPTVVIARGVTAFDEGGHALGARVSDRRAQADTIPAEREVVAAEQTSLVPSILFVIAAAIVLVSAGLLVQSAAIDDARASVVVPRAVAVQPALAQAPESYGVETSRAAALPAAPPTALSSAIISSGSSSTAEHEVEAEPAARSRIAAPPKRAGTARVAPKAKRDIIVRDNPF